MSDELIQETQQEQVIANAVSPFDNEAWSEQPFVASPVVAEEKVDTPVATVEVPVVEEQKVDTPTPVVGEWYKGYGWDNEELAKAEIEKLRQTKEEIKYANEESEKLHKAIASGDKKLVLDILSRNQQLEELSNTEVNIANASSIVKTAMKFKYADLNLTDKEIDFKFNKQFGIPPKPAELDSDTPGEYQEKLAEWEKQKENVEMELLIEAKVAKPELAKLKQELVLPDTPKQEVLPNETKPTQEEIEKAEKFKGAYLQSVEASVKKISGITVAVKDKDVEIPLSYDFSTQEKEAISERMKHFAESGYNATAILADLWADEEGNLKTDEMAEDLSLILFKKNINQKLVNDAANKRLELYLKGKKNININETSVKGVASVGEGNKSENEKLAEWAFGS
jgi:predicted GNAT family acetyltransferase